MESDERADRLEQLFRQTLHRVMAYCLRRTDEAAAADAAAEVYAIAWRRKGHVPDDEGEAALWLLGIARRVLANQARSQRRWSRLLLRVAERSEPQRGPDYRTGDGTGHDIGAALAELLAADREILRLAYWDDLSRHDIAVVLGISVGAVDTRLHRARDRLRRQLASANPDPTNPDPTNLHHRKETTDVER